MISNSSLHQAADYIRNLNFSHLDPATCTALDDLFRAVTHDARQALRDRQTALWREAAVKVSLDDLAALTRTEIVDGDANPWALGDMALIRRTDLDTYFLVSTNDEETLTVMSDAQGRWPKSSADASVLDASGHGLTRAAAIKIIDQAPVPVTDSMRARHYADDTDD